MKPKHTPGPWEVTEALDGTLQPFQAGTGRHLLSCEGDKPLPRKQREHNGAVIAQAPELLRLLKETMPYIPRDEFGVGATVEADSLRLLIFP